MKLEGQQFSEWVKKIVLANIILAFQHLRYTYYPPHSFWHAKIWQTIALSLNSPCITLSNNYFLLYSNLNSLFCESVYTCEACGFVALVHDYWWIIPTKGFWNLQKAWLAIVIQLRVGKSTKIDPYVAKQFSVPIWGLWCRITSTTYTHCMCATSIHLNYWQ